MFIQANYQNSASTHCKADQSLDCAERPAFSARKHTDAHKIFHGSLDDRTSLHPMRWANQCDVQFYSFSSPQRVISGKFKTMLTPLIRDALAHRYAHLGNVCISKFNIIMLNACTSTNY